MSNQNYANKQQSDKMSGGSCSTSDKTAQANRDEKYGQAQDKSKKASSEGSSSSGDRR